MYFNGCLPCKKENPAPATPPANPPVTNTQTQLEKDLLGYWYVRGIETYGVDISGKDSAVAPQGVGPYCYMDFKSDLTNSAGDKKYKCVYGMFCSPGNLSWEGRGSDSILFGGAQDWRIKYKALDSLVLIYRMNPGPWPLEKYARTYLKKK